MARVPALASSKLNLQKRGRTHNWTAEMWQLAALLCSMVSGLLHELIFDVAATISREIRLKVIMGRSRNVFRWARSCWSHTPSLCMHISVSHSSLQLGTWTLSLTDTTLSRFLRLRVDSPRLRTIFLCGLSADGRPREGSFCPTQRTWSCGDEAFVAGQWNLAWNAACARVLEKEGAKFMRSLPARKVRRAIRFLIAK